MSGLYRMEAQRDNGIIVTPLTGGPRKFIPARQHLFTPLDNITIYTDAADGMPLHEVFLKMKEKQAEVAPVPAKSSSEELHRYFAQVVPEYDAGQVYASDIKKMIKWFHTLDEAGLVTANPEEEEKQQASDHNDEEE